MVRFFHSKINLDGHSTRNGALPSSNLPNNSNSSQNRRENNARIVRIRLIFIRIGEIDTLNEKYQAEIYFEARWNEKLNLNALNLTVQQQTQIFQEHRTVKISEFNPNTNWTPQLFIENAIGQIGEQEKWFTVRNVLDENHPAAISELEICEHRRLKGVFWEKLELNHFPVDVQDLTISITSHRHTDSCVLVQDHRIQSSINREAFIDQQEWKLYQHVASEERFTKDEYSFETDDMKDDSKTHPVLAITCRAARRPGYFYWNGFFMIFLITVCAFCIFSIPPDLPQNRLQITCTLVLTSVTFRWVVNRSLPTVSYLTTLDQYAIISIVILIVLCVWHSVIAVVALINAAEIPQKPYRKNLYVHVDRYVFFVMFAIYVLIHLALLIWLLCVPYKRRRQMLKLDDEYTKNKQIQMNQSRSHNGPNNFNPQDLSFRRAPSIQSVVSMMKTPERAIFYSNSSAFFPIDERTMKMSENSDEVFDHPKV